MISLQQQVQLLQEHGPYLIYRSSPLEIVIIETGEIVAIGQTEPTKARRIAALSSLNAPQSRPDDGVDRIEVHKRLREMREVE